MVPHSSLCVGRRRCQGRESRPMPSASYEPGGGAAVWQTEDSRVPPSPHAGSYCGMHKVTKCRQTAMYRILCRKLKKKKKTLLENKCIFTVQESISVILEFRQILYNVFFSPPFHCKSLEMCLIFAAIGVLLWNKAAWFNI